MTTRQTAWAAEHDWFRFSTKIRPNEYRVTVCDAYTQNGELFEEIVEFTDFAALRAWAGY